MTLNRLLITIALGLFLGACGSGGTIAEPLPRSETEPPTPTTVDSWTPASACPDTHKTPLFVSTAIPEEVEFLDQVDACTNVLGTAIFLRNSADIVWTVSTSGTVEQLSTGQRLDSFGEIAGDLHPGPLMFPNSEIVVHAASGDAEWSIHPGLSATWVVHDQFADAVESYGTEQLTALLAGDSLRRKAHVKCSLAAWNIAGADLSGLTTETPGLELLEPIRDAIPALGCAQAWQLADLDDLERYGRAPTWSDDGVRWIDDAVFVSKLDDQLSKLRRIANAFRRIIL